MCLLKKDPELKSVLRVLWDECVRGDTIPEWGDWGSLELAVPLWLQKTFTTMATGGSLCSWVKGQLGEFSLSSNRKAFVAQGTQRWLQLVPCEIAHTAKAILFRTRLAWLVANGLLIENCRPELSLRISLARGPCFSSVWVSYQSQWSYSQMQTRGYHSAFLFLNKLVTVLIKDSSWSPDSKVGIVYGSLFPFTQIRCNLSGAVLSVM